MTREESAGCLSRWSMALQEYNFEILYSSGKKHQNADALSRRLVEIAPKVGFEEGKVPVFSVT